MIESFAFIFLLLLSNSVHSVSASDCIEKEGFGGKNFRLIKNITTVGKDECKQECIKVQIICVIRENIHQI